MSTEGFTRKVRLGSRDVEFPSAELSYLEDCNQYLGDREALGREMEEKGYLYLRGLHDREEVLEARLAVLQYIREAGEGKLRTGHPWKDGVLDQRCGRGCLPFMEGVEAITHRETIAKVLEGPRPFEFFRTFLGEDVRTFDYKWLRGVHKLAFTGAHVDNVYMSRGTQQLYTMWTPIGDVNTEMGTLAVCEGSHRLRGFKHLQETYGNMDCERDRLNGTGWFTLDPFEITSRFGGQWKTADFKAGDALIFTMRTVHMSTANLTDLVRISCDTRWQPASHPADPRFVGDCFNRKPEFGFHEQSTDPNDQKITIDELRKQWGFI